MKDINLPFQIGEQYEIWEFDLEVLAADKIRGYDSYYYTKDISFNGLKPARTELIFGLDVLEAVILSFEPPEISYTLRKTLLMKREEIFNFSSIQTADIPQKIVICIMKSTKFAHLLYGKKPIISQLINNLRNP